MAKVIKLRRSESGWSHREQTSLVQTQLQEDSMLFYLLYWHSKKFANVFNHCTLHQDNKKDLLTRKDYAAMLRIHVLSDSYKSCCLFQIPLRNSRMWLNKCLLSMWCARKEGKILFHREKKTTQNEMFNSRWLLWMWQLNLPTNIYKSSNNKKYQQISTNLPTI